MTQNHRAVAKRLADIWTAWICARAAGEWGVAATEKAAFFSTVTEIRNAYPVVIARAIIDVAARMAS